MPTPTRRGRHLAGPGPGRSCPDTTQAIGIASAREWHATCSVRSVDEDESPPLGTMTLPELLDLVARRKAGQLLERAGGLTALAQADAWEIAAYVEGRDLDAHRLRGVRGWRRRGAALREVPRPEANREGALRAARAIAAAFELGRRVEMAKRARPRSFRAPQDVATWASPRMGSLHHEELWLLALDGRGALRSERCVARGGLHGAAARPSDPVRTALRADASGFVLVHNHPSGDPTPSREDIVFTAHVAAAAAVVGVPLLDHVVVARDGHRCIPIMDEASARAF